MAWVGRFQLVGRRLLMLPIALFILTFITFALLHLVPGDAALLVAGERATPREVEIIREAMGLDRPFFEQYIAYLGRLAQGDLGRTAYGSAEISELLAANIVPTLWLTITSLLLSLLVSTAIVVAIAATRSELLDSIVRAASAVAFGMPAFWLGLMLLLFVAIPLGLPIGGWPDGFAARFQRILLPAVAMSTTLVPMLIRSLRSSFLQVIDSDYLTVGRSIGLRGWPLLQRYVMRNAVIPSVPLVAILVTYLLGGVAIIEATFGIPGLGLALVQAAQTRDVNYIQGLTLVIGVSVIAVNLLADIVVSFLDPRVKAT